MSTTSGLHLGPRTEHRPGDAEFWNAPFGAVLGYSQLRSVDDPLGAAVAFFEQGWSSSPGERHRSSG